MKYIITWFVWITFDANHSNCAVIQYRTVKEAHWQEFTNREAAIDFYNQKMKEKQTFWEYNSDLKLDSIKINQP